MSKKETRKRILETAEKLFSVNGFDGVPTRMIASEAGITEMTLFNHFPNKKALYETVIKERFLAIDIASVFSRLPHHDLKSDLDLVSTHLIDNFTRNKNILLMRFKEKEHFQDDTFKIEHDPLIRELVPLFEFYEEREQLTRHAYDAAVLFTVSVKGLFYVSILNDSSPNETENLIDDFVQIFSKGLKK